MARFFWMLAVICLLMNPVTAMSGQAEAIQNMTITRNTPKLNIDVRYPVLGMERVDADIAEWAKQLANSFQADYENEHTGKAPYELNVAYTVLRPSPLAVSVVWEIGDYTGGAHGNLYIATSNYEIKTGKALELDELFQDSNTALNVMSAYSYRELSEKLGDMKVDSMLRSGTTPDPDHFANIALIPQGVRVYFSPYEVAPWAAGVQQVDIPLEELREAEPRLELWGDKPEPPQLNK